MRGFAPGEQRRRHEVRRSLQLPRQRLRQRVRERFLVQVDRSQAVEGQALDTLALARLERQRQVEVVDAVRPPAAGERRARPRDDRLSQALRLGVFSAVQLPVLDLQAQSAPPCLGDAACGFVAACLALDLCEENVRLSAVALRKPILGSTVDINKPHTEPPEANGGHSAKL
jgi:hypothetical protein